MKRRFPLLLLFANLLWACGGNAPKEEPKTRDSLQPTPLDATPELKEFKTVTVRDRLCFVVDEEDPFNPEFKTTGVLDSFSIEWPREGMMTDKAMQELMSCYFSDETTTDIRQAVGNWRKKTIAQYGGSPVKNIDENRPYSYSSMTSTCRQDSTLATFTINYANYNVGMAHGIYAATYLTVDVETGNVVHLYDLVDTTRLGYAIARAIQDLDVNSDIRDCLFDEYRNAQEMPVYHNFFIDSTRSTINVVYNIYEITPYCCGIQTVALPVHWLSKHLPLTPYAKRLFGPGSAL